jgi:predicted MarR family transcription regulator
MQSVTQLHAVPLSVEDINLITYALRRLSEKSNFATIKSEADNLRDYLKGELSRITEETK